MDKYFLIGLGGLAAVGGVIGALAGWGLSSVPLSPLVIGGIIAAMPAILLAGFIVYDHYKHNTLSRENILYPLSMCAASTAIGVGLAAAASAIFPGVMLAGWSAALAGGLIGVIAPIAGLFATKFIITPIVGKVSEWITSPKAELARGSEEAAPAP